MPTDEQLTPDELEQQQAMGPDDEAGDSSPVTTTSEADAADVFEQSQTVPEDPDEEERA